MKVLCIIGPSGVGKSSIVSALYKSGLISLTPSVTDRPQRIGEQAVEHRFVSAAEFNRMLRTNAFIGTVQPFNLPYRYGLPLVEQVEHKVPLVMLRAPLIEEMSTHYSDLVVYQIEAPYAFAEKQVKNRDDSDYGSRLTGFEQEVNLGRTLANRVFVNGEGALDDVIQEIARRIKEDFNSTSSLKVDTHADSMGKK